MSVTRIEQTWILSRFMLRTRKRAGLTLRREELSAAVVWLDDRLGAQAAGTPAQRNSACGLIAAGLHL